MPKKTRLPLKIIKIENDGFHLLGKISINGKSASVVLDTGASRTVFDKKRIRFFTKEKKFGVNEQVSAGLGTKTMKSLSTVLEEISLGKISIPGYPAVLLDLSHVNSIYESMGYARIDGILGNDLLVKYKARINYEKKELLLFY